LKHAIISLTVAVTTLLSAPPTARPAEEDMMPPAPLLGFANNDGRVWQVVNDGVMGGISRSEMRVTEAGTGLFTGALSIEHNGGFASVRTSLPPGRLAGHRGLQLRVRGDGHTYQLRLRINDRFDGVAYRHLFATHNQEWQTINLTFADFEPTFRGRILDNVPPLDPALIHQLAFMLADKTPGPFALEIECVQAMPNETEKP
jgi:monofunctional biosynthetic peptidoglycan transglycosylase